MTNSKVEAFKDYLKATYINEIHHITNAFTDRDIIVNTGVKDIFEKRLAENINLASWYLLKICVLPDRTALMIQAYDFDDQAWEYVLNDDLFIYEKGPKVCIETGSRDSEIWKRFYNDFDDDVELKTSLELTTFADLKDFQRYRYNVPIYSKAEIFLDTIVYASRLKTEIPFFDIFSTGAALNDWDSGYSNHYFWIIN